MKSHILSTIGKKFISGRSLSNSIPVSFKIYTCTLIPLEDISNTQKIRAVMANGRYFDRKALDRLLAEAEKAANPQQDNKPKTK